MSGLVSRLSPFNPLLDYFGMQLKLIKKTLHCYDNKLISYGILDGFVSLSVLGVELVVAVVLLVYLLFY